MRRVLAFVPMGPPFAGPEVASRIMLKPDKWKCELYVINTSYQRDNSEKGRVTPRALFAWFKNTFKLLYYMVRIRPDVFYFYLSATELGVLKDFFFTSLILPFGPIVVAHARGGHYRENYELFSPFFKLLARITWNRCDVIVVQAHRLKGMFDGLVPLSKLVVFPNPAPKEFFGLKPDYSSRTLLYIGHRSVAKGWVTFLEVIPRLVDDFQDLKVIVVGDEIVHETNVMGLKGKDPRLAWQEYVLSKGLEGHFEVYTGVYGEEKLKLFERASVFVLPSFHEGFSMAVLEAMTAGLAVVTTPVGALPEVLPPETPFVSPGDPDGLYRVLYDLLKHEGKRRELGELNRKAALKFHEDKVISSFSDYMCKL